MVPSNSSHFGLCLAAVLVVGGSAFAPTLSSIQQQQQQQQQRRYFLSSTPLPPLCASSTSNDSNDGRRNFLQQLVVTASAAACVVLPAPNAHAGLLDDFGSDPTKIAVPVKQVEAPAGQTKKGQSSIDPTLKGSYYYPTAKKRYLPRIQKVTTDIEQVPQMIANEQWEEVEAFAKTADNAVLPLQLYVSSLDGQGLSMANSYAKTMKKDATCFETQYKILVKAVKSKNKDMALSAVQEMGVAVVEYRQVGRLSDDDGNIPSVDEIKRSTMRRTTQAQFSLQ